MKKNLLFLAAGAMTLTACTSEEVVDVSTSQGNAITFENVINKSTRADGVVGDVGTGNFDTFFVYGYYTKDDMPTVISIFNGETVTKANASNKWEYSGETRYWLPDYSYQFFAYSCGDIKIDSDNGKGLPDYTLAGTPTLTLIDYLCDNNHQHDLVTAKNGPYTAEPAGNQPVTLSFNHALCKIQAVFVTDFPSDYHVYVSDVYLSSFDNKGDFDVRTGLWSDWKGSNANPIVDLYLPDNSYVQSAGDDHKSISTNEVFLIPKFYDSNKKETVQLHFKVTITKDGQNILEKKIVGTWSPEWEKGTKYKYSINITGKSTGIEPIVFATEQSIDNNGNTWGNTQTVNMTFSPDESNQGGNETEEPQP